MQLRSTSLSLAAVGLSVPIDVYIDSEIRSYLKIKNQCRKVRIFAPKDKQIGDITINFLRHMIETKGGASSQPTLQTDLSYHLYR